MNVETFLVLFFLSGVVALLFAFFRTMWISKMDVGDETMRKISEYIRQGAMAFLKREYSVLVVFVLLVALLLAFMGATKEHSTPLLGISVVIGALCSALAGFFGMRVATLANVRTAAAARKGLNDALKVAFAGGAVMGFSVVGLAILGLSILFLIYFTLFEGDISRTVMAITGFSFGASSIALFARVGGGIYTKAADVGADLVGKVEAGIPEDDPRNPAVIADNVGDNVGDVAGMGADLFESYVGAIVGAMVLGAGIKASGNTALVILPLALAASGIIVSLIGTLFVRTKEGGNPQAALNTGTFIAAFLMLIATYFLCDFFIGEGIGEISAMGVFVASVAGLIGGVLVGILTEYFTSEARYPAQSIARDSQTGVATNIISGIAVGMKSTFLPVLVLVITIIVAYSKAGLYGIAIAALGMLSTTGIQLAVDAYGPIADNAGGIAEMSNLGPEVRSRTDKLDAVGNTTAAIGKGFAIGSAALTALALFAAFKQEVKLVVLDISNPWVMGGVLLGACVPYLFSSFAIQAVGRAAFQMIEEVRRQFKEIKGLLDGKAEADYARCVDISTRAAIKEMILPGVIAVLIPVVVGFLNKEALGGLLAGVTTSGVVLAIFMANAGGAWDNAKKFIEGGEYGGKGSDAHKAAVVGDTVGDPFKDTAGPSLNILIKLMSVVSLVLAPFFI